MQMFLSTLSQASDGIYSSGVDINAQAEEKRFREEIASRKIDNYLQEIAKYHSVPVMDKEVKHFLKKIPKNGVILDVGGCWGWHWRNIETLRPDVRVVILDFVRKNLKHAKKLLRKQINRSAFLLYGDATSIKIGDNLFDGYWSVQTMQHIPNFKKAAKEAFRVLKPGGVYANYSLNNQALVRFIYRLLGKHYHVSGKVDGSFYLDRASNNQIDILEKIFGVEVVKRYSEILFSPELLLQIGSKERSITGKLDSLFSSSFKPLALIARQQSHHLIKNNI